MQNTRNESLDILRGLAIVGMILSGSIAQEGVLPAWMYHAQVPPPAHKFVPTLAGITWVDLVFPFFLFAMGAAMPLAFAKKNKESAGQTLFSISKRAALLVWFAVFLQHLKPYSLAESPMLLHTCLSLLGFALLWFMYGDIAQWFSADSKLPRLLKIGAFIAAAVLALSLTYGDGTGFRLTRNDIIILVLANIAFFGGILYWVSKTAVGWRLAALPILLALILTNSPHGIGGTEGWQMDFTRAVLPEPFKALYHFNFLKYLFIVLPATFAGEWILAERGKSQTPTASREGTGIAILSIGLVLLNLVGLFTRVLALNLFLNLAVLAAVFFLIEKKRNSLSEFIQKSAKAGAYLLLLGLTFETLQGGIKKDNATFSYFFLTGGLAFFLLIAFELLKNARILRGSFSTLKMMGQNPILAYVAGSLCITPLMKITRLENYWTMLDSSAGLGFLKGVIYTALVAVLTVFATKKKWFWKT